MRIELQQLELIDAYLNGSMNAAARSSFELELQQSESLKSLLENQKLIIQAVQRKALLAEINTFSAPNGIWTIAKWLSVFVVVGSLIAGGIYWNSSAAEKPLTIQSELEIRNTTSAEVQEIVTTIGDSFADSLEVLKPGQIAESAATKSNHQETRKAAVESLPKVVSTDQSVAELDGLKTWIQPKMQYFDVDPKTGKTIECKDGTLIIVPTNAFLDKNGNAITENVQLEIVEALSVADMLAYNLTTMNNDKHLQSGGMIYVQPTVNGEKVNINPERPLHIEIPTTKEIPGMLAWKGETDEQGDINWVDPKPLEKSLTPVDFDLLDFLPTGFADEVEASLPFRNHQTMSKELVDSLYYSLSKASLPDCEVKIQKAMNSAGNFKIGFPTQEGSRVEPIKISGKEKQTTGITGKVSYNKKPLSKVKVTVYSEQNVVVDCALTDVDGQYKFTDLPSQYVYLTAQCSGFQDRDGETVLRRNKISVLDFTLLPGKSDLSEDRPESCMIDPLTIKTIKTSKFANTFLATKEFEERMKMLHEIPNAQFLLELYINNLNLNLCQVDSMVALRLTGENKSNFNAFAALKHTNVKDKNIYQDELSAYYNQKRLEFEEENTQRKNEYSRKSQAELENLSAQLSELEVSFASGEVVKQSKTPFFFPRKSSPAVSSSYKVNWYGSGWMNIDAYVKLVQSGSKDVSIQANTKTSGARIYQSINTLQTIIPLNVDENGEASAKFPKKGTTGSADMQNVYCVGISKDEQGIRYASQRYNPYETNAIDLEWTTVTENELYEKLNSLSACNAQLVSSLKKEQAEIAKLREMVAKREAIQQEMNKIQAKIDLENRFMERLRNVCESCESEGTGTDRPFELITNADEQPQFPGGKMALTQFISSNLNYPEKAKEQGLKGKCWVRFTVETDGSITNPVVTRAIENCPECDQEVIRVIQSMPKWIPAKLNGKPIKEFFDLPVSFTLQ